MAVNRRLLTVLAPTSQLNFKTDHLWFKVQSEFCMKKSMTSMMYMSEPFKQMSCSTWLKETLVGA